MFQRFMKCKQCHQKYTSIWKPSKYQGRHCFQKAEVRECVSPERLNCIDIQMLSQNLHRQIFPEPFSNARCPPSLPENLHKIRRHLDEHGLLKKGTSAIPDVHLSLPKLEGNNIDEHFQKIAWDQSSTYFDLACKLSSCSLPKMPSVWQQWSGWTRYMMGREPERVTAPLEDALIFDVEVCIKDGNYPILATAVSDVAWYCWVHPVLSDSSSLSGSASYVTSNDCIPLDSGNKVDSLIVGHYVCFDRSYVKEQYELKAPSTKFLDTMSLHMCVSGLSGSQRALLQQSIKNGSKKEQWMSVGSLNNLADVYALYTGNERLDKSMRDIFVEGTVEEIRQKFQESVFYCANDVRATHEIFTHLWPMFLDTAPHPVTFAGMLEMATAYLPVNNSWLKYIQEANDTFENIEDEMKSILMKLATQACELTVTKGYNNDPWLWNLDWSIQELKVKKKIKVKKKTKEEEDTIKETVKTLEQCSLEEARLLEVSNWYPDLPKPDEVFHKKRQHMAGFPSWFRKFCRRYDDPEWESGPVLISAQARIAPLLLRMTWDGYPLFYNERYGWGYLVPGRKDNLNTEVRLPRGRSRKSKEVMVIDENSVTVQVEDLQSVKFPFSSFSKFGNGEVKEDEAIVSKTSSNGILVAEDWLEEIESLENIGSPHEGLGPFNDINLPGVWFYKIPHKDGEGNNCGNPLGKDYLSKMEEGSLVSLAGARGKRTLELNKMISFWRNASKRICSQMTVWHNPANAIHSRRVSGNDESLYGVILPRMKVAGTVTRRVVEETWMTASNPRGPLCFNELPTDIRTCESIVDFKNRHDRVGSELKSLIRAPPGYVFVGADVDSQELWIAAILGDAHFAGAHGGTAFGWMNLQGKKSEGTDLHSKTANTIGISRDHAKIFNYGRIYGAGKNFAKSLLLQFNHRMSDSEAEEKAEQLYLSTKGTVKYRLTDSSVQLAEKYGLPIDEDNCIDQTDFYTLVRKKRAKRADWPSFGEKVWKGGSESEMFNKLEKIAVSEDPRTPVLGCRVSRALRPNVVDSKFMTSRINWVVQSSAVDYLHLMLVCMKWLITKYDINGRFSISIHDEVRYLVDEEDKYRASLALQMTNLLTRSMFAYKLGLNDLPQSVAFFSAVDIDKVVRKEVTLDCKTPSNPDGLAKGHGIQSGEALDIYEILTKTNGGNLEKTTSQVMEGCYR